MLFKRWWLFSGVYFSLWTAPAIYTRKKIRALPSVFKTYIWLISSCKLEQPEESEEEGQITDAEHLVLDF